MSEQDEIWERNDVIVTLRARVVKLEAALKEIVHREPWKGRKNYSYDDAGLADYWSDMAKEFQEAACAALSEPPIDENWDTKMPRVEWPPR